MSGVSRINVEGSRQSSFYLLHLRWEFGIQPIYHLVQQHNIFGGRFWHTFRNALVKNKDWRSELR